MKIKPIENRFTIEMSSECAKESGLSQKTEIQIA